MNGQSKFGHGKQKPGFPLPDPVELAKLAAILQPRAQPEAAIQKAMQFYIEALLFVREVPSSLDAAIMRFGSEKRRMAVFCKPMEEALKAGWEDTLELDPLKDDDPSRRLLAKNGLSVKTGRAVLENIRRFWAERSSKDTFAANPSTPEDFVAQCAHSTDGRVTYAFPRFVLLAVAAFAKKRRSEAKRKAWQTRQRKSSV